MGAGRGGPPTAGALARAAPVLHSPGSRAQSRARSAGRGDRAATGSIATEVRRAGNSELRSAALTGRQPRASFIAGPGAGGGGGEWGGRCCLPGNPGRRVLAFPDCRCPLAGRCRAGISEMKQRDHGGGSDRRAAPGRGVPSWGRVHLDAALTLRSLRADSCSCALGIVPVPIPQRGKLGLRAARGFDPQRLQVP